VRLNRDEPQSSATVPGPLSNIAEISGHYGAMYTKIAGVRIDAFAFIMGDHQERHHKAKGHAAARFWGKLATGSSAHKRARMAFLSLCGSCLLRLMVERVIVPEAGDVDALATTLRRPTDFR
jgi:hypothetical protein